MAAQGVLLIGVGMASAVWLTVLARRVSTLTVCLGYLAAASCLWTPFASWEAGPITLTIDRLAVLALLIVTGLKRLLTPQPPPSLDRQDVCLIAWIALLTLGVLLIPWKPTGEGDIPHGYRFVASYFIPALVYGIVRFRNPRASDTTTICRFFLVFGLYLAVTAFAESRHWEFLVLPKFILQPRTSYVGRAVGPFLSAPHLGTWLTIAFVAALLTLKQTSPGRRFALVLLLPLLAYAQYLTQTRSAWMGFALALAFTLLSVRWRIPRQFVVLALLATSILLVGSYGTTLLNPPRAEGRTIVAYSINQRLALLDSALTLFSQKPLFGWGFGQFEHAAREEVGAGMLGYAATGAAAGIASHNVPLRVLVETGMVGFAILAVLFWRWIQQARRVLICAESTRAQRDFALLFLGALIAYASEALFHDVTHLLQANLMLFFLAGCLPRASFPFMDRLPKQHPPAEGRGT